MKTIKGCLIEHAKSDNHFDAYAHQCNCFCRMGRGIAPLLAEAFPEVREVDNSTNDIPEKDKLGHFTSTEHTNPKIYNLYGQYHWTLYKKLGANTDYGDLTYALIRMVVDMESKGLKTLGIPLIGCGLAGGDWNIVSSIIKGVFSNSDIEITLFIKD